MIRNPLAACCAAICLMCAVACQGGQAVTPPAPGHPGHVSAAVPPSGPAAALGAPAGTLSAPAPAPTRSTPPRGGQNGCGTGPARRAWAMEISVSGGLVWGRRLRTDPTQSGVALPPLALDGTAVFAEENTVYALGRSDGRLLWRRSFNISRADLWSNMVYGAWPWRGTVVVLVGQASPAARLVSLDAATGAVRWTLPLSARGVTGDLTPTGDGGLAMIGGDGTLSVADLSTGGLRWSRPGGFSPAPVAVGGAVVAAAAGNGSRSGRVAAYDTATGRPLWSRRGMPAQPLLQVAAGRVLVYTDTQNVVPRRALWPVTALSPATGRTQWRATAGPVGTLSVAAGGIAVSTAGQGELYLIDPVTGSVRWHLAADVDGSDMPLVTGSDVVYVSRANSGAAGGQRLMDLRASDGSVRWAAPLADSVFLPEPVLRFGPDLVVSLGSGQPGDPARLVAYQEATGAVAWVTKVLALVQVPPSAAGRDLLVQPTDPAVACPAAGSAAR